MLLLRAFYDRFTKMQDQDSKDFSERIASCIWKTNEMGKPDKEHLKIDSVVATDKDKDEFLSILKTGNVNSSQTSRYANNFRFFLKKVDDFINDFPKFAEKLPARILNNCILMPIEAESQDTALRIFSTLNDRGLPLSDSDIFKAQFYKYYKQKSEDDRDEFIKDWKKLEETCEKIFHPITGTPMDDLFTRYNVFHSRQARTITSLPRPSHLEDSMSVINIPYLSKMTLLKILKILLNSGKILPIKIVNVSAKRF